MRVAARSGRSRRDTLPSGSRERTALSVSAVLLPPPVSTIKGKSDHGGWLARHCASAPMVSYCRTSSATIAAPAPWAMAFESAPTELVISTRNPDFSSTDMMSVPSLPNGASTSNRKSRWIASVFKAKVVPLANYGGYPSQNSMKVSQRFPNVNAIRPQAQLANGVFVRATALFDHGDCLANFALRFEVAKDENVVGEIADVSGCLHAGAYHSCLREDYEGDDAAVIQVRKQFVQVQGQELVAGHRLEKAVQAIDNDGAGVFAVNRLAHEFDKLAWRHFGRVEVHNVDLPALDVRSDVHSQSGCALGERTDRLFKEKKGSVLTF